MATKKDPPPPALDETPGLVGGPGPTPPGVDDGTPKPALEGAAPESAASQQRAGEAAERSAGTRQADVGEAAERARERGLERRDPEEPDPS
jgi:hypothetical protein